MIPVEKCDLADPRAFSPLKTSENLVFQESSDLGIWTDVSTHANPAGRVVLTFPMAPDLPAQFFRFIPVE